MASNSSRAAGLLAFHYRKRDELAAQAAAGNIDAQTRLQTIMSRRQKEQALRDRAAAGDEDAIRQCEHAAAQRRADGKKYRARAKAKREAGDQEAIRMHEARRDKQKLAVQRRGQSLDTTNTDASMTDTSGIDTTATNASTDEATTASTDDHPVADHQIEEDDSEDDIPLSQRVLSSRPQQMSSFNGADTIDSSIFDNVSNITASTPAPSYTNASSTSSQPIFMRESDEQEREVIDLSADDETPFLGGLPHAPYQTAQQPVPSVREQEVRLRLWKVRLQQEQADLEMALLGMQGWR